MAMALAGAMVACQGAAGTDGKDAGVAPQTVNGGIPDQSVEAGGSNTFDLAPHFTDPNGDDAKLKYKPAALDAATATAEVSGMNLTVNGIKAGMTTITVTATDGEGLDTKSTFKVTVTTPDPPEPTDPPEPGANVAPVASTIPTQSMMTGADPLVVNLSPFFTDADDDELTFSDPVSSNPAAATVELSDSTLTITAVAAGMSTISVTATDPGGMSVMGSVDLTVSDPDSVVAPESRGMIEDKSVEAGMSLDPIDVSMYFTPTGLDYGVESSDPTKATATVAGNMVTIRGVAEGLARVIVTATNSAGSETQTIEVTVIPMGPDYKPSMATIIGVTETEDVRIDPGQTLQSLAPTIVTATPKSDSITVWTLTGKKKGTAMVRIWNAGRRSIDKTITVRVENSLPMVTDTTAAKAIIDSVLLAKVHGDLTSYDKNGGEIAAGDVTTRAYHLLDVDVSILFKDADNDIAEYKAESNDPYVEVVKVITGETDNGILIDVMKDVGFDFPLEVYAVDKSDERSGRIELTAAVPEPHADVYEVAQNKAGGAFGTVEVWRREGVSHQLTFKKVGGSDAGFNFVKAFEDGLEDNEMMIPPGLGPPGFKEPDGVRADASESAIPYYTVSTAKPVKTVALSIPSMIPTLMFTLEGTGGTASVTITYHTVVCTDDPGNSGNCLADSFKWNDDATQRLMMKIKSSS